ncbi:STAS domain-containing protein [bacterium]|nr:STAS domain-containing protein [bacterium]
MEFTIEKRDDISIIAIDSTNLGGPGANQLSDNIRSLIDKGSKKFIIDMKKVEWMNSSGLGILIAALNTVKTREGELCLLNIQKKTEQLLAITKLNRVFKIYKTEEEAVAGLSE